MKANRILLLMLSATMLFSACTKKYYTEEIIVDGVQLKYYDFNITNKDWSKIEVLDNGFILSVKLDVPAITESVVNKGSVMISRQLMDDNNNIYWTPLPVIRAEAENYGTDDVILYSTYLDYEWTKGTVYVYFTATDFFVEDDKSYWPNMVLRVAVME